MSKTPPSLADLPSDVQALFAAQTAELASLKRVSDILCMSNLVHAFKLKEHEDNDNDYE